MARTRIPEVTDSTFQAEVLEAKLPTLVEFTAPWCGPCRAIDPTLEAMVTSHAGRLRVTQLNVDENQEVAQRYRVMSVPTLIVFREGQPVGQVIGAYRDRVLALAEQFAG